MLQRLLLPLYLSAFFCSALSLSNAKTTLNRPAPHTFSIPTSKLPRAEQPPVRNERAVREEHIAQPAKEWNIFIYIAGNNNLYSFIDANMAQALAIGSNERINIVVQVDKFGTKEVTRSRVNKGALETYWRSSSVSTAERNAHPELYNSGSVENFTDFLVSGMNRFKAKKQCVIIWNHGSGIIDPTKWRHLGINDLQELTRGMAFNDNYGYYLSSQDLTRALSTVSQSCLGGEPVDLLGLDICCGGQLEIATQAKGFVRYMVASQEAELASGWDYTRLLKQVAANDRTPLEFATDIVNAYKESYISVTPDYTLAVYDLAQKTANGEQTCFEQLEATISDLATTLVCLLRGEQKNVIRQVLADIRKRRTTCCEFYCSEYVDLHLLAMSMQSGFRQLLNLDNFRYQYPTAAADLQKATSLCRAILDLIYKVVPTYTAGIAFAGNPIRSRGISIAFPLRQIYPSYFKTTFAQQNQWLAFLREFVGR